MKVTQPLIVLSRRGDSWVVDFSAADLPGAGADVCVSIFSADESATDVQAYYRRIYPQHAIAVRLRDAVEGLPELRALAARLDAEAGR